nr:PhzF family phenazine biosynthesis protein [Fodinicola feengrottensis]
MLPAERGGHARIRIFTPAAELPFAGHPTLGTAIVLAQERGLAAITLETGAGDVRVTLERTGDQVVSGQMAQPIPSWQPYDRAAELLAALGVRVSALPIEIYQNGPRHVYVALDTEAQVAAVKPDLSAVAALGTMGGVSTFAAAPATTGRPGCSAPGWVSPRTRRPAPRPARSPFTWPGTGEPSSASASGSARALRSDVRRPCTPKCTATATRSTRSWSPAPPSSWRAVS